jgi:hypothetical protein
VLTFTLCGVHPEDPDDKPHCVCMVEAASSEREEMAYAALAADLDRELRATNSGYE